MKTKRVVSRARKPWPWRVVGEVIGFLCFLAVCVGTYILLTAWAQDKSGWVRQAEEPSSSSSQRVMRCWFGIRTWPPSGGWRRTLRDSMSLSSAWGHRLRSVPSTLEQWITSPSFPRLHGEAFLKRSMLVTRGLFGGLYLIQLGEMVK